MKQILFKKVDADPKFKPVVHAASAAEGYEFAPDSFLRGIMMMANRHGDKGVAGLAQRIHNALRGDAKTLRQADAAEQAEYMRGRP